MDNLARLNELVTRWQELRLRGQPVTPEELCRDCPDLLTALQERLTTLSQRQQSLTTTLQQTVDWSASLHAATTEPEQKPEVFHAGQEPVPGFRLVRRLGEGGFGQVWEALAPGDLPVAMKLVRLGQSAAVEQRALAIIKAIRHPHLLATFGTWQNEGYLIIAMELADRTLSDRLDEVIAKGMQGIPHTELLRYFLDTAGALDYLNKPRHFLGGPKPVGIQHCDIKPHNLLLLGGGVKVADFGLVQVLEGQFAGGGMGLTPLYAPPERFEGKTSRHSDQYSLAVSYCHLRGGKMPFQGTFVDLYDAHRAKEPDLSMLPEEERPIVRQALAKDPAQRWPNCRAFVKALAAARGKARPDGGRPPPRMAPAPDTDLLMSMAPRPTPSSRASRDLASPAPTEETVSQVSLEAQLDDQLQEVESAPLALSVPRASPEKAPLPGAARPTRDIAWKSRQSAASPARRSILPWLALAALLFVGVGLTLYSMNWGLTGTSMDHARAGATRHVTETSVAQVRPTQVAAGARPAALPETMPHPMPPADLGGGRGFTARSVPSRTATSPFTAKGTRPQLPAGPVGTESQPPLPLGTSPQPVPPTLFPSPTTSAMPTRPAGPISTGDAQAAYFLDSILFVVGSLAGFLFLLTLMLFIWRRRRQAPVSPDAFPPLLEVAAPAELEELTPGPVGAPGESAAPAQPLPHFDFLAAESTPGRSRAERLPRHDREPSPGASEAPAAAPFAGHTEGVWSLAFTADGRLISGSLDGTLGIWTYPDGQEEYRLTGHEEGVTCVVPYGESLVFSGSLDGTVRLWNADTHHEIRVLRGHTQGVLGIALAANGKMLASCSLDGSVLLWETTSGREPRGLTGTGLPVWDVAFSPDGQFLAVGSGPQRERGESTALEEVRLVLWDVHTGEEVRRFTGHTQAVRCVAFAPDGQLLASGSADGTVRLWEVATGSEVACLVGHSDWVRCLAFSPDGKLLLSGSDDETVRLWSVPNRAELDCFLGHDWSVTAVTFTPSGREAVSGSDDQTIRRWNW